LTIQTTVIEILSEVAFEILIGLIIEVVPFKLKVFVKAGIFNDNSDFCQY